MRRGVIVLAKFPFTDLHSVKRRPTVIVSRDNRVDDDFILAFITSVIPDKQSDTDLFFGMEHKDFKKSGLLKNSIIKLNKLATLNKSILSGELGSLSNSMMKKIDKRLKIALDLK